MDIKDFYKQKQNETQQNTKDFNAQSSEQYSSNPHQNQDFSEYQNTINKYKDLSQNELYSELLNQASSLKSQGKLDDSTLNTISTTLSPMLTDEQRQLLNNIIEKLK
jgi:hypothetical protein